MIVSLWDMSSLRLDGAADVLVALIVVQLVHVWPEIKRRIPAFCKRAFEPVKPPGSRGSVRQWSPSPTGAATGPDGPMVTCEQKTADQLGAHTK